MMHYLSNTLFGIYIVVCIGLIVSVASQTSKNEGLTGTLGGKVEAASFLRKKTLDEQVDRITSIFAWSFLVLSTAIVFIKF